MKRKVSLEQANTFW